MKPNETLFSLPAPVLGRPKTSSLSRQEQNREAQRRRREALKDAGKTAHTFHLSPAAVDSLCRIKAKEGTASLEDAAEAAFVGYAYKSANIGILPAPLVESLEELFPEIDLHEALIQAAQKHVAEVHRKRLSSRQRRSAQPR